MAKIGDVFLKILSIPLICLVLSFGSEKEQDRIIGLPGQPSGVSFKQYSGYVTVDSLSGRALFYYFVESPTHSSTKPLVLWLNGGPACSPLAYGAAFGELGPFKVNPDRKTLSTTKYGWNNVANIIFLEFSAGVGFSYSNTTSDYKLTSDQMAARDSYTFLLNWIERFPEYKTRDFYIAGYSYAGHHVPQLAQLILRSNNKDPINLRGIVIGNGFIDIETLCTGRVDFYSSHALISDEQKIILSSSCNKCYEAGTVDVKVFHNFMQQFFTVSGNLSINSIYAPLCKNSPAFPNPCTDYDPCASNYFTDYLNIPEVQAALHANITKLPYAWEECSDEIRSLWSNSPTTMLPTIQELIDNGLRVWLYSGDVDPGNPAAATQYAIRKMKLRVETPWQAWYTEGEVGGYVVGYGNVTFVTIRGAGHDAPNHQPARALAVFSSFLMNRLPPRE